MKRQTVALGGAVAAGLIWGAGSVLAQGAGAPAGGAAASTGAPPARVSMRDALTFEKMDANRDGKVTLEEYQAAMAEVAKLRFKSMDANNDGTLSAEEVNKSRESFGRGRGGFRGPGGEGRPNARPQPPPQGAGAL